MKRCKYGTAVITWAAVCFSLGVLLSFFLPYYVMIIALSVIVLFVCILNLF